MNAVVLTVKASYVASTKYRKHAHPDSNIVMWKMKVIHCFNIVPKLMIPVMCNEPFFAGSGKETSCTP